MSKVREILKLSFGLILTILCSVLGLGGGVMLANAANLPDAGKTRSGEGTMDTKVEGVASVSTGTQDGDDDFYQKAIDERIIKIRPMATPVDQISRYATGGSCSSQEVKYFSLGTRPIQCKVTDNVALQSSGTSVKLPVDDASMFTVDDTIRVVGVKGKYDENGKAYPSTGLVPDLVLSVCGHDEATGMPIVYAVNGVLDGNNHPMFVPAIPKDTKLIRMGKACAELDVQTGRFNNIPTSEVQYCQNFMIQIEGSTFEKLSEKQVNWSFSDVEEDGIYDMRVGMEISKLFGVKCKTYHPKKNGSATYFTHGIWWMAGKDIEVGKYDASQKRTIISDDDLVDISKDLFVGTGLGGKRKVMFCGSEFMTALSKIKSEKFRLKESVEVWNLKFKSWDTDFGEILAMHHELFDINDMSDCAFSLDPEYLSKRTFMSWTRNILDLKTAGVRNTEAVVIQEVSCIYLRYAKAHARLRLAKS
jgi:hypothetical protein